MNNLRYLSPIKQLGTWTPASKSGLMAWFRADTLIQSSGVVTSWTDKSSNGFNATPTNSPTVVSSVINGQPVVRFNSASTQYFTFGGTAQLLPAGTGGSVIVVAKGASALSSGTFAAFLTLITSNTSNRFESFYCCNSAGYTPLSWGGGDGNPDTAVGISGFNYSSAFWGNVWNYNGGTFSSTGSWSVTSNNASQTVATSGATNTNNIHSYIGAFSPPDASALPWNGDIAEIILYNSQITGTDVTNLHSYLNTRYGVGIG